MCDDTAQIWSLKLPQIVDEGLDDYRVEIDVNLGDARTFIAYSDSERTFT